MQTSHNISHNIWYILGKSFNMVNSYVQNRTQPSIETLYKIASILEVEVDELLYSKEDVKRMNNVNLQ
ncbi:MAG: hypothetical protein BHV68_13525 [Bacteroidales bacterium 43_8]|nr:MAG: hypothetical protein BHV68_13525 [Bacteroidales bacterium 43_8]